MKEGNEKGKVILFPQSKITRMPAEVAELEMQRRVDGIALRLFDKFGRSLDQVARKEVERVKGRKSTFSLKRLAEEVCKIEDRRRFNLPIFPSDIATIELYLSKREETRPENP